MTAVSELKLQIAKLELIDFGGVTLPVFRSLPKKMLEIVEIDSIPFQFFHISTISFLVVTENDRFSIFIREFQDNIAIEEDEADSLGDFSPFNLLNSKSSLPFHFLIASIAVGTDFIDKPLS